MRLLKVRHILSNNVDKLRVSSKQIPNSPNVTLSGFRAGLEAAIVIQNTGVLQQETKELLSIAEVRNSALKEIVVHRDTGTIFVSAMETLRTHAGIILNTFNEFLGKEEIDTINIKLPTARNLDDVAKTLSNLNLALEQSLVNTFVNGQVQLIGFDRGSNWLEIGLGSIVALQFLGGMVRLIYESRNKEIELEAKREMIRHLKLQNEVKEKVFEAVNKELEDHYAQSVDNLLSMAEIRDPEPEYRKRLVPCNIVYFV
jgi:hypothetical protein